MSKGSNSILSSSALGTWSCCVHNAYAVLRPSAHQRLRDVTASVRVLLLYAMRLLAGATLQGQHVLQGGLIGSGKDSKEPPMPGAHRYGHTAVWLHTPAVHYHVPT